jgi:hypothetical protein
MSTVSELAYVLLVYNFYIKSKGAGPCSVPSVLSHVHAFFLFYGCPRNTLK